MNRRTFVMHGALQLICVCAMVVTSLLFLVGNLFLCAHVQAETHMHGNRPTDDADWSELIASMDKMHMAMGAIERSGNNDVDFVRLMLPHHQAAIDMAKTQLLYGKDPQMRRLAQEIVTDQQLEIELMQHWLKQR
ncbi:MAG TPA: DUF305 domain-containing protein [Candidatus Udaeobacter sp.]